MLATSLSVNIRPQRGTIQLFSAAFGWWSTLVFMSPLNGFEGDPAAAGLDCRLGDVLVVLDCPLELDAELCVLRFQGFHLGFEGCLGLREDFGRRFHVLAKQGRLV